MAGAAAVAAVTVGSQLVRGGQEYGEVERLGFMAGCWEGRAEGGTIDERWTPAANIMLGTTRYLSGGRVTGFEFAVIAVDAGGEIVMTPYGPEHDFPKRILYGFVDDSLSVRIDGGEGSDEAAEWKMGRVDCEEGR
jgi:hypothetical protein